MASTHRHAAARNWTSQPGRGGLLPVISDGALGPVGFDELAVGHIVLNCVEEFSIAERVFSVEGTVHFLVQLTIRLGQIGQLQTHVELGTRHHTSVMAVDDFEDLAQLGAPTIHAVVY